MLLFYIWKENTAISGYQAEQHKSAGQFPVGISSLQPWETHLLYSRSQEKSKIYHFFLKVNPLILAVEYRIYNEHKECSSYLGLI